MKKYSFLIGLIFMLMGCVSSQKYQQLAQEHKFLELSLRTCQNNKILLESHKDSLQKLLVASRMDNLRIEDSLKHLQDKQENLLVHTDSLSGVIQKAHEDKQKNISEMNSSQNIILSLNQIVEECNKKVEILESEKRKTLSLLHQKEQKQKKIIQSLEDNLKSSFGNVIEVKAENNTIQIIMPKSLFFESQKNEVLVQGHNIMNWIAMHLGINPSYSKLHIYVPADETTLPEQCAQDHWDLATFRSNALVRLLITQGVKPDKVIASAGVSFENGIQQSHIIFILEEQK